MNFEEQYPFIWHKTVHPLVVGIGGGSRAGKTTLALHLKEALPFDSQIISLDDCVLPEAMIPRIRNHINWEIPESIDYTLLRHKMETLSEKAQVIILEGLFVFSVPEIFSLLHLGIFLTISRRKFIAEKKMDDRWGIEPLWYIYYIWKAYKAHAFAWKRLWGNYPLVIKLPGNEAHHAIPELISLIQRLD
ncbi:MAG: uridine kinase family protein [Bacteroidales bacterium]